MTEVFKNPHALPGRQSGEIDREDLLRIFQECKTKLIVLAAGSGYGKTVLLSQWANWAHLGNHFGQVIAVTLTEENSESPDSIIGLIDVIQASLNFDSEQFQRIVRCGQVEPVAQAIANLFNILPQPTLLLIDGGQHLSLASHIVLERMVYWMDRRHRCVLTCYSATQIPPLASLIARGEATVLGPQDLAFSLEETTRFLGSNAKKQWVAMDGWPIALRLLQAGADISLDLESLARWVLDRLPLEIRQLLRELSVTEIWSEKEAHTFGIATVPRWMEIVQNSGLPIARLNATDLRPHELLRRQLRQELQQQPTLFMTVSLNAARHYESRGQLISSIHRYLDASALPDSLRLACVVAERYLQRREFWKLRTLLEIFPDIELPSRLREWQGIAFFRTNNPTEGLSILTVLHQTTTLEARSYLALAEAAMFAENLSMTTQWINLAHSRAEDIVSQLAVRRFEVDFFSKTGKATQAMSQLPSLLIDAEKIGDPYEYNACLSTATSLYSFLGNIKESAEILFKQLEFYKLQGLTSAEISVQTSLGLNLAFLGNFNEAINYAQVAAEQAKEFYDSSRVRTQINIILIKQLSRDFEGALHVLNYLFENLDEWQAKAYERAEVWMYALLLGSRQRDKTLVYQASRSIETQLAGIPRNQVGFLEFMHRAYIFSKIYARLLGENHTINQNTNQNTNRSDHQEKKNTLEISNSHQTMLVEELEDVLDELITIIGPPFTFEIRLRLVIAEINRRLFRTQQENLDRLGALLTRTHALGLLTSVLFDMPRLREILEAQTWWQEIRLAATPHDDPQTPIMTITTLGCFNLHVNGTNVYFPYAKCIEFLVYLAIYGAVKRDVLINALWDGSNDPKHARYFRVIVSTVRQSLSQVIPNNIQPIIYSRAEYSIAPEIKLQLDISYITEMKVANVPIEYLWKVAKLYNGYFLPNVESEWAITIRTQIEDTAILAFLRLAQSLEQSSPTKAIEIYERLITLNSFLEDSYIGLERIYKIQNNYTGLDMILLMRKRNFG